MNDKLITIKQIASNFEIVQNRYNKTNNSGTNATQFEENVKFVVVPLDKQGNGRHNYGLPFEVVGQIFSNFILQKPETSQDFWKEVNNWYISKPVKVTKGGRVMNIGCNIVKKDGVDMYYPTVPEDYILYHGLLSNPTFCADKSMLNGQHIVVVEDAAFEQEQSVIQVQLKQRAALAFENLQAEDEKPVAFILKGAGLGFKNTNLTEAGKKDLTLGLDEAKEQHPEEFIKICEDKNKRDKYFIEQLITYGLFRREGNIIFYEYETVGSMNKAITWLKDSANNGEKIMLLRQQLIIKTGIEDNDGEPVLIEQKKPNLKK